ncbi:MAG: hypothetical protein EPO21_24270 [Chloroflexota bacterium]|nr:MAG: hypothetical protein EPO21_24270 [Chloroflexota bacterium]
MIVRILSEGQYRLNSTALDKLNDIDNQIVKIVASGDQQGYQSLFQKMIGLVRQQGTPVPEQELVESDVIIPQADTSFEEAKSLFVGDGLVPD